MELEQYGGLEISEVEENIEPGKYVMQYVDEQEIRNDRGWVGCRMSFQIQGPKHEGRLVSGLFTVANPNSAKSVEIGKTELSALAAACDLTTLKNTEELRGIRFTGMVKINDNGYPELDAQFGKGFSKATQAGPTIAEKEEAEAKPLDAFGDDDIPF